MTLGWEPLLKMSLKGSRYRGIRSLGKWIRFVDSLV